MENRASESASVWSRRMEKGSHEFVVKNYSLRKRIGVNVAIQSPEFVVGGHRWSICFFPDGWDVDAHNDGYASLYIYLKSERKYPVQFLCELYILDQSGEGNHHGFSIFEGFSKSGRVKYLQGGLLTGRPRFISRALLESPNSKYLKDDCVRIHLTLGVFDYGCRNLPFVKVRESNIGADFGNLLESKQKADVFIKVADETFSAHKLILAARCPALLLHHLSNGDQLQDHIFISDMEPRILKAVLWFIYTGTLHKEELLAGSDSSPLVLRSFLVKMLAAAHQLELTMLKQICESHISELTSTCLRFATQNQAAIMDSDGCEYRRETCPLLCLELAGFIDNPSTIRKRVLYSCIKVLSTFESLFGRCLPWDATTYLKHKIKEI